MKKICSAFLITLLLLVILVPGFSDDSNCVVTFTANNPDIVTIPPNAPLNVGNTEISISLLARTGNSYSIAITKGAFLNNGSWRLTNTNTNKDYLDYTIKDIYGVPININEEICCLAPNNLSSTLIFTILESDALSIVNGLYSDTLTFTITAK